MNYRVGQRVRLLHDSGEGVITRLIDREHVEVDLGDDFPVDMHMDEIIPIHTSEVSYLAPDKETQEIKAKSSKTIQTLGTSLLDLSLVVVHAKENQYELHLVNPEPIDALFTCFVKSGNKYEGITSGELGTGERFLLTTLELENLNRLKGIFFQFLLFLPGKGYPHTPLQKELKWGKGRLQTPPKLIQALKKDGWAFSLRDDKLALDVQAIEESEFVRVRKADLPSKRKDSEVDIHIEELTKEAHRMSASEMLKLQLDHLKKILDEAISENHASLVIIHGVGVGTLKKEVHKMLKKYPEVKEYLPADPAKYGNGATKVIFK